MKIVQGNAVFRGKRHNNKILNVQILLSRDCVVIAQAPKISRRLWQRKTENIFIPHFCRVAAPNNPNVSIIVNPPVRGVCVPHKSENCSKISQQDSFKLFSGSWCAFFREVSWYHFKPPVGGVCVCHKSENCSKISQQYSFKFFSGSWCAYFREVSAYFSGS